MDVAVTNSSSDKIFVAGQNGMVGSAIMRQLQSSGVAPEQFITRSRGDLDLVNQAAVDDFFKTTTPDQVYLCAAKVGGIHANDTYPAEFIYQNLMIEANIIDAAFRNGVKKLLFLGSSCIYPRMVDQPMGEDALLTGTLEPTNEPYAIAKIAGIKLCESYNRQYGMSHGIDYRCVMPTNLYGPGDNYHSENSHVIPAMIRRFDEAKNNQDEVVTVWGSGKPLREFLYVDDMAAASIYVMGIDHAELARHTRPMQSHINVGSGTEITIAELAQSVANTVGFQGRIEFDKSKPDGTPRKLMDSSRLNSLGWQAGVSLQEGLKITYQKFLEIGDASN